MSMILLTIPWKIPVVKEIDPFGLQIPVNNI
jgi:hypothetical protein